MSLATAQKLAWNLANTLMVCITLFKAGAAYSVVPSDEFDGPADSIVREYDPFD